MKFNPFLPLALIALMAAVLLPVPTAQAESALPSGEPWQSEFQRDHPLSGRIWQPSTGKFLSPENLIERLAAAPYVLLGEKHNNLDHHLIQAWVVEQLVVRGRRPAVAFEMMNGDQQADLDAHLAARPRDAEGIGPAVGWAESGWPDWATYQPIAAAALAGGGPLLAASWPRRLIRGIMEKGLEELGNERLQELGLDRERPATALAELREEIIESHCNQLPETMIDPMVSMTGAKDAFMAAVLRRGAAESGSGAVLIAGGGHTRKDWAVPWYLSVTAPGAAVVALDLAETSDALTDTADYAARYGGTPPYDYVWFTPRVDEDDPCEVYAEQLKKAKERHQKKEEQEQKE